MSEKRHKINKFANYQNIMVKKQSRLGPLCFCSFSKPMIYGFRRNAHDQYTNPLARPLLIALQVVRTSWFTMYRQCTGSSFLHPLVLLMELVCHHSGSWFEKNLPMYAFLILWYCVISGSCGIGIYGGVFSSGGGGSNGVCSCDGGTAAWMQRHWLMFL